MFDLYHSIHRVNKQVARNSVPCILPNSELYLVRGKGDSGRLLVPPEVLALMGLDLQWAASIRPKLPADSVVASVASPSCFSWGEIMGLAGNAFSGFAFAPVALAALHLLADTFPAA